jgi:hypothetical protein
VIEPGVEVASYPLLTGRGLDTSSASNFRQSTEASTTIYGLKIKLVPLIFAERRGRIYIGGGGGLASTSAKNQRDYLNASGTITSSNQERSSASGQSIDFFAGTEFFVVQNWSVALNLGYRIMKFDGFSYEGTTNVRGQTVNKGADVLNNSGALAGLNATSTYGNLQFIVHF